jgi:hypothetical protein
MRDTLRPPKMAARSGVAFVSQRFAKILAEQVGNDRLQDSKSIPHRLMLASKKGGYLTVLVLIIISGVMIGGALTRGGRRWGGGVGRGNSVEDR